MDVINESIVKFIEALIVDDYSKASNHLGKIVNEKVKLKIKDSLSIPVFESHSKKKKKSSMKVKRKKTGAAAEENTMPKAKNNNKNYMKGVKGDEKDKSSSFKTKFKK